MALSIAETISRAQLSWGENKTFIWVEDSGKFWAVIKGEHVKITKDNKTKINKTGTPKMTRGGTGDVLAGLTTSFLPRVKNPFYAATISSFLNGKAGELVASNFSSLNLISKIPEAIQQSLDFISQD